MKYRVSVAILDEDGLVVGRALTFAGDDPDGKQIETLKEAKQIQEDAIEILDEIDWNDKREAEDGE